MILSDSTIEIPLPIKLAISREKRARSIFLMRFPIPGIWRISLSLKNNHHSVFLQLLHKKRNINGERRNKYQKSPIKLLTFTSICVDAGNHQKSEKSHTRGGTTFHMITNNTISITIMMSAGYTSAPIIFLFKEESFSICEAISRSVVLSLPVFSPDSTMAISESQKLLGNSLSVEERFLPEWMFSIIFAKTFFTAGFFCSSWRILIDWSTVNPAFTIVARSR